ncbi:nose resistant to fluoxetine protein 6 [Trichonephila clavipes]|nr:nose resistant to fluoxetine protein 6 [Trichonephila clavipes]
MDTSNREGHLLCLHGIRCLSMIWIILCHDYVFSFNAIRNPVETFNFMDNWYYQILLNGFFSVDSFFLLSGFLVAHLFFEKIVGSEKISWTYFYIHRYIRLTPVYMIVMGFYTTLYAHLSSGPLWIYADTDPNCQVSWWYNLLYINNFQTMTALCMGWSWYLANDMQFFVISPLLLIPLWRWPKIGYLLIGVFFYIIFGSNFFITYKYNLSAGLGTIVEQSANVTNFLSRWTDYFDLLYIKPYTRMGPYLVGIVLAYYIHKRKQNGSRKLSLITLTVGWVFSSVIALFCLFGLYHCHLTIIETAFYNALSRTAFGCCLAWVISLGGVIIEEVHKIKYLGIIVDNKMQWKEHISNVSSKSEKILLGLLRISNNTVGVKTDVLQLIYKQGIVPLISYASRAWEHSLSKKINSRLIRRTQRRFLLRVIKGYKTISYEAVFAISGIPPIN